MDECQHQPSHNPRQRGICVKCGRSLPIRDKERDPTAERALTLEAAQLTTGLYDPVATAEWLSRFSEERMHDGPWREFDSRDWVQEGLEELADNRNYACAEMLRLQELGRDDEDYWAQVMALKYVIAQTITLTDAWFRYRELRKDE